jgi:hypothetical protein
VAASLTAFHGGEDCEVVSGRTSSQRLSRIATLVWRASRSIFGEGARHGWRAETCPVILVYIKFYSTFHLADNGHA